MNKVIGTLTAVIALAFAGTTALAETVPTEPSNNAAPITAELAKTCRELAIKAHPTEVAGTNPLDRLNGTISRSALPNAAICKTGRSYTSSRGVPHIGLVCRPMLPRDAWATRFAGVRGVFGPSGEAAGGGRLGLENGCTKAVPPSLVPHLQ